MIQGYLDNHMQKGMKETLASHDMQSLLNMHQRPKHKSYNYKTLRRKPRKQTFMTLDLAMILRVQTKTPIIKGKYINCT
jgi:hypothetical protein